MDDERKRDLGSFAPAGCVVMLTVPHLLIAFGLNWYTAAVLAFSLMLMVAVLRQLYHYWKVDRPAYRRRTGRCVNCGYDLRGSPGTTCPECGLKRP